MTDLRAEGERGRLYDHSNLGRFACLDAICIAWRYWPVSGFTGKLYIFTLCDAHR
jgi:hypothetical protein